MYVLWKRTSWTIPAGLSTYWTKRPQRRFHQHFPPQCPSRGFSLALAPSGHKCARNRSRGRHPCWRRRR
ncbi:hypothetical protein COCVIDRAFT_94055 [Bipolaris victoriae FI3]|uniref:Uncharacterized protein n=1 Tax=Bipolaris victoriae (strain FI3) TaxID=930091 RepID=W7EPJ1_BIPV3|nr:hypothetical protein COCVIDRAFT_94055 [Bipolaris victoriae FI3]